MEQNILFDFSKASNKPKKFVSQRAKLKKLLESYKCENEDIHNELWYLFIDLLYVQTRNHYHSDLVSQYDASEENLRAAHIMEKVGVCSKAYGDVPNVFTINFH